jgi:hypothetical protein
METVSAQTLGAFFAWAPLVLGIAIYLVTFAAKRKEVTEPSPLGTTFACANCGRRGEREHMVPQSHSGAISWLCAKCAGAH